MKKTFILLTLLLTTLLTSAQTTLLSESFNVTSTTSTFPTGWSVTSTGTTNGCWGTTWNQVPSGGFVCASTGPAPNPTAHSGTGMAGFNSWDIRQYSISELVTPALNFSGPGTNYLSMWVYNYAGFYLHDSIRVFVNTSPTVAGSTMLFAFDPVYNPSPTGWTQYSIQIPTSYNGSTNYIIFRGYSDYGYDVFFDDVEVTHYPPTPCTGTPLAPTINNTPIAAATPLCTGASPTLNATDPNFPTISNITYQWESAPAATGPWTPVSSGTGATTLSYNTGALTTSTYFRMVSTCGGSGLKANSSAYLVPIGAPQPSTITGSTSFCPGDPATYSVTNVSGTSYTWTLPAGWSGSSTSNSITVTPGSTSGSVSVTATTTCGTSIARSLAVVPGSAPTAPATITGNNSPCLNSAQTYSISPVTGATSYSWSVPTGWSISSGATGTTLSTTTSSSSGNIVVSAINGCGSSSKSMAVNVVTTLSSPGTITGPTATCAGGLYTYTINAVPGATSYQWTLPSGWSGTNTGTSIQVYPGSSGGTISVTAYSPCATSPSASLTASVSASVQPLVTISTSTTQICQSLPVTFTATPTNGGTAPTYIWTKNGNKVLATGNTYLDNSLYTGDVIGVTMVSNAACRTSDSVLASPLTLSVTPLAVPGISITSNPVITICSGTNVTFNTNITGGGNSPSYQWYINSIPIGTISSTYTTNALNNNDTVSVRLATSAACSSSAYGYSNRVVAKVNPLVVPSVTVTATATTPMAGLPITFTATYSGGGPTPDFQWIINNVDVLGARGSTFTTSSLVPGDRVTVRMQSYDPCANPGVITAAELEMRSATSVAGHSNWEGSVTLYPNPTAGNLTVGATWDAAHIGKRVSIDVFNLLGQSVYHSEVVPDKSQWHYDVKLQEGTPDGHYTVRLSSADGMRANGQIILKH